MADVKQLKGMEFRGCILGDPLGDGGSAIVYAATMAGRDVAVKVFFPDALSRNGLSEETERLELQLQLKGQKRHSHLVEIIEGGVAPELGNTLYLIMERVPGESLDKLLNAIPRTAIGPLMKQLAEAAKYLEDVGLVHRDIKPANVIVNSNFTHLTLLDLGIVKGLESEDSERLSGSRFVGTARYSPPEFVWRSEGNSTEEWRAITFYQIGGVLHDLLMRQKMFTGHDQPPSHLYDAIKLRSPVIDASDCASWLVLLAKCCLVKDWRERFRLVTWDSFSQPDGGAEANIAQRQTSIRLRQVRLEEMDIAKVANTDPHADNKRIHDLWDLQDKLFLEIRRFLRGTQIFPRFSTDHVATGRSSYKITFKFEKDAQLGFSSEATAEIILQADGTTESTELKMRIALLGVAPMFEGTWKEALSLEKASQIIQQALVQAADKIVPEA